MKMRKSVVAITALALLALITIPAFAEITGHTWLGTAFSGHDDYYNANVNAYRTGSTAILTVTVQNNRPAGSNISVSRVYVAFDWGQTYNATQMGGTNATLITNGATRVFSINFTVPSTSVASNLYRHSYTIFADYSYKNPSNTSQTISTRYQSNLFEDFAVYSSDQADAMNLADIIDTFPMPSSWQSAQAQILANQARNETATAQRYYEQGNFALAKQRFNAALSDLNQAWSAEQSYLTMLQDLQIQRTQAEIRSLDAMTSFFNGLSTMWVLFGIGWVLLGIGYIIKYLRAKRAEAPAA